MRFCEECGAQLEDNVRFCEECGVEQEPLTVETVQIQEAGELTAPEILDNETTEYGFCEECGARIRICDAFCESCGTAINAGKNETTAVEIKQGVSLTPVVEETVGAAPVVPTTPVEKKKGKAALWIAVISVVLVVAVVAGGYFIVRSKRTEQNPSQNVSDNSGTKDITELPVTNTVVTPSPVPDAEVTHVSIFEGFRVIERLGTVITIESPDGLTVVLDTTSKPEAFGYISDGEHSYNFSFKENHTVCYPENFYSVEDLPEKGHAIYVEVYEEGAYVYWSYQQNGESEVYYDGWISSQYFECIGQYTRWYENSLKQFETSGKVNTSSPFTRISDGEVIEVVYTGDNKENFSLGLVYNHEIDVLRMELYNYETESYLCGYANGQIYYGEDTVYYLQPVFADDGVYWEEIPYTLVDGKKQYDLSPYDIFCEVRMHVTEEGITLYWSACEYGDITVFYDDFFDSKNLQRKAYVNHF